MTTLDNAALEREPRKVLNVGSGNQKLAEWEKQGFQVVTLDISDDLQPDIVADMCNMGEIGSFDAVWCCHAIEHLYPHQVPLAIGEFHRILKPGGVVIIAVPDLEDIRPDGTILGDSNSGPITAHHLFYGDKRQIAERPYMAHHCGFVSETLREALSGFSKVQVQKVPFFNLLGSGVKE